MRQGTGRLRRSDRIRRRKQFERISREGRRHASRGFVILIAPSAPLRVERSQQGDEGESVQRRLGITASRRVGNAVVRTRMKRAVREWFRCHRDELEENVDIVVIVRRDATTLERDDFEGQLSSLAQRPERGGGRAKRKR
jgi:ribonuclease P protein component